MHNGRHAGALAALLLLSACSVQPVGDSGPRPGSAVPPDLPDDPVPRAEPRSRYGNGPIYEVYGRPYRVLDSSHGYQQRGVASWYGSKFHGRLTSSQEPYDMHQMTAAHKTLPLPTYVRVTNLRNNRSVIVRVNDRGPFVDNRIIDLSYAAARKLDMVTDGTSLVEVTAISFDEPPAAASAAPAAGEAVATASKVYVQVGAFGERDNAERRYRMLHGQGIANAFVHRDDNSSPALYRVRIGPIADVDQYDSVVARLAQLGIADSHIVTE
jgi:peptidoglycan lytic transglycosylase